MYRQQSAIVVIAAAAAIGWLVIKIERRRCRSVCAQTRESSLVQGFEIGYEARSADARKGGRLTRDS